MAKYFIVLLLCMGLSGCASYEYTEEYHEALKAKTSVSVTKEENLQELLQRTGEYFQKRGYKQLVYENLKSGFLVFEKEGDFDIPCQIILKFSTQPGTGVIRIDLVDGSQDLVTDSEISEDIRTIAELIRNEK